MIRAIENALRNRPDWTKDKPEEKIQAQSLLRKSVRTKDIADFTRQLSVMLQARLPLAKSLEILLHQQKKGAFRNVIEQVLKGVKSGNSLSESMSFHPRVFGPLYVNLLSAGEVSGNLSEILQQLSIHLEKMVGLRRKILTAMTYPAVIVVVAVGAISFLVFGVMPTFSDLFQDFDARMPLPARILIGSANFVKSKILFLVLAGAVLLFLLRRLIRSEKGGWMLDRLKLKIPLTGPVVKKVAIARFARTLGTLLSGGVPLLDALEVTARSSGNRLIEKEIIEMKQMASKGEAIEKSMSGSTVFPDLVIQMIAVGEETAELPRMLARTAEYYESETDASIDAMTSVIEPLVIVVLGVILGGTMIAIYMQIFDLMNVVQ